MGKKKTGTESPVAATPEREEGANAVLLAGRLAGSPAFRDMPSGDSMVQFRLVVRRSCEHGRRDPRSPTVDTIDCVSWSPSALGDWTRWNAGDHVSLAGCLRRRFWRAGGAVASRYEVEVHQATWSAPPPAPQSPGKEVQPPSARAAPLSVV